MEILANSILSSIRTYSGYDIFDGVQLYSFTDISCVSVGQAKS